MRVESLHIYPVKGMKGCDVSEAAVIAGGLRGRPALDAGR